MAKVYGPNWGRRGRSWRRVRARVLAKSTICILCGHPGSQDVNHNIPLSIAPELGETESNLSPIHGSNGCYFCPRRADGKTRKCNHEQGSGVLRAIPVVHVSAGDRTW